MMVIKKLGNLQLLFSLMFILPVHAQQEFTYSITKMNKILANGNHNAFPSVVSQRRKKLIVGYRSSKGHLEGKASANMIISNDNGKNWSDEVVLDDGSDFTDSKYGIRSLTITQLKSKTLFATYHNNNGDFGGLYFKTSHDKGKTWSERKEILFENYETNKISCEGHLIQINGKYILPVFEGKKNDSLNVGVAISKDLVSWKYFKLPDQSGKELENIIVKDENNHLIMFYSDPFKKKLFRSTSQDDGYHWTNPEDVTFKGWIIHRPNVYYDSKAGAMLLIYREGVKQSGALAISYDEGLTWKRLGAINNDQRRITYGDFIQLSKNKIGMVFATEQKSNGYNSNLYFAELERKKKK